MGRKEILNKEKIRRNIMPAIMAFIVKTFFTEKIVKAIVIALGEYLVKSSKNKLDDIAWAQVKKALK
jgi:hypothetical protein